MEEIIEIPEGYGARIEGNKVVLEPKESEDKRIRKGIRNLVLSVEQEILSMLNITRSDILAWLEKQGEQKYVDRVESRFKIEKDRWYVCIRDLDDNYGTRAFCKGSTYLSTKDETLLPDNSNIPFEIKYCVNDYFRLWTIQDAKDGDVLVGNYDNCKKPWIGIFKCISKDRPTTQFDSYCFINSSHHTFITPLSNGFYNPCKGHTIRYALPATKEQCDLLFHKMKEAGYEWDAEKKELRKIEWKPAWSEDVEAAISLLKDIAEEQEKDYCPYNANHLRKAAQYLETCRPRDTWKPSESDILLLERIANGKSNPQDFQASLGGLIERLKKLREE